MRSPLITACMLLMGAYAPVVSVRPQIQQAPAQAQAAPPQHQAQTARDWQGTPRPDIRRGNTPVAAESSLSRRRAESHRSGGLATDAQPGQPGNRQVPGAVGLLLALALLSNAGAVPPPAVAHPDTHQ